MHVSSVYALRQALALDRPGTPVKVIEPYQMLGEIQPDLMDALGVDFVGLVDERNIFGFKNEGWKEWTFFDGTPVLVPEGFNTEPDADGNILIYPEGDRSAAPSGMMPKGGWYFDALIRQDPIDEERLNVEDNLMEFGPLSAEDLAFYEREVDRLYRETDKAVVVEFGFTGFGDVALVAAPWLKRPRGIRDVAEWYMSLSLRRDYVYEVFSRQCELALANLERVYGVVGDRVSVASVCGSDLGTQTGPFLSVQTYRELFQPFHKQINDWIHQHTTWKTFFHSCGSVFDLMEDFVASGFDILNPVQCSAAKMDPGELKRRFGSRLTFWGGGVDTQSTLPFGTSDEVRTQVRERIKTFGPGGGFVFNPVHNVQACVPPRSLLAMYEALREYGRYPL